MVTHRYRKQFHYPAWSLLHGNIRSGTQPGARLRRILDGGRVHNSNLPLRFPVNFVTVFLWSTDTLKMVSTSLVHNVGVLREA